MVLISNCTEDTENIGEKIGAKVCCTEVLALWGGMGMGKTALTRGIARHFGIEEYVSSPTFAIMNEYSNEKIKIYHFDMYRISGEEDLESTGFYSYLNKGLIIIEWSENIKEFLPQKIVNISIMQGQDENQRQIEIEGIKFD